MSEKVKILRGHFSGLRSYVPKYLLAAVKVLYDGLAQSCTLES